MSRIAITLSIIFVALVLPVVIIYPSNAQPADSPPPIPSSFSNSTYINTTLGIQLQIPTDWLEEDFTTDNGWKGVNFTSLSSHSFLIVNIADNKNNNNNKTTAQLVDSLKKSIQNITQEDLITFAGLPAYQIISLKQVPDPETGEDTRLNVTDVITSDTNKTYHIKYGADANERQAFSTFKNILATFKIGDINTENQTPVSEQLASFIPQQPAAIPPQQSVMPQLPLQQQQPNIPPPISQMPFNPLPQNPLNPLIPVQPPFQPLPPIQPIKTPPRILSYNNYFDSIGSMHIVGEVINESLQPMDFVKITATFYDTTNRVVGTDFSYADPDTLQPGQRAPFEIIVFRGSIPMHLIASYTLAADYSDFSIFR